MFWLPLLVFWLQGTQVTNVANIQSIRGLYRNFRAYKMHMLITSSGLSCLVVPKIQFRLSGDHTDQRGVLWHTKLTLPLSLPKWRHCSNGGDTAKEAHYKIWSKRPSLPPLKWRHYPNGITCNAIISDVWVQSANVGTMLIPSSKYTTQRIPWGRHLRTNGRNILVNK